jgi:LysR family transcriptional activator of mexEF-oprN operon
MRHMNASYGRDLDLNLLRVFAVVADAGSVTEAASRLYLTQPAVSAALRRLTTTVGAPLFVRRGRGLALTSRGERLRQTLAPHLQAIVDAALTSPTFDPATSERTLRLGLSDAAELWLLPALLRVLAAEAPRMRVIAIPVQFRTVAAALATGLDAAITVADDLPTTVRREPLMWGTFVCLYDPRHRSLRRMPTVEEYFACEHVIVSYNGDLRGIVEDLFQRQRTVRCSVSTFANLGAIVDASTLVATVPDLVADQIRRVYPHLATRPVPFEAKGAATELLWPTTTDDDVVGMWARDKIRLLAATPARKR